MQGEEGEGEVGEEEEGGGGRRGRKKPKSVSDSTSTGPPTRETEVIEAVVDIFHLKLYHPIIEGKVTHVPPPPVVLSCAPVNCANCQ